MRAQEASDSTLHMWFVGCQLVCWIFYWFMDHDKVSREKFLFSCFRKKKKTVRWLRACIFRKVFALIQSNLADSWHAWEWRMRIFESIHTSRFSMKSQLSRNWQFFSITHSTLCTRRKLRNVNDGRTKATNSVRSDTRAHFIFLSLYFHHHLNVISFCRIHLRALLATDILCGWIPYFVPFYIRIACSL